MGPTEVTGRRARFPQKGTRVVPVLGNLWETRVGKRGLTRPPNLAGIVADLWDQRRRMWYIVGSRRAPSECIGGVG